MFILIPPNHKPLRTINLTEEQKCVLDNLWMCYNSPQKDRKPFLAILNALATNFKQDRKFKCYVVFQGRIPGIFHTWTEVVEQVTGISQPSYQGFHSIPTAHEQARKRLGPNYYVTPSLRHYQEPPSHRVTRTQIRYSFVTTVKPSQIL